VELSAYNILNISFVTLLCPFAYWTTLSLKVDKAASQGSDLYFSLLVCLYKQHQRFS